MDPSQSRILRALVIFINSIYKEMFRAVRVFRQAAGGSEETEEKEYVINNRKDNNFGGNGANRVLTLYRFDVSEQKIGFINGVWKCVYVFDSSRSQFPLVDFCDEWTGKSMKIELSLFTEACSSKNFLDLNSVPDSDAEEDNVISEHKKRRATPEDISRIALEDLTKYFDLPITKASKNLKVGLTVLKKKCRELGIPRWPHRKIKSLDRLIRNLQEEMQRQQEEEEDEATTMAMSKKKRMVEFEKERIEKKPSMDIQEETKKFRQDIFKRTHRARVLNRESQNRNLTLSLS